MASALAMTQPHKEFASVPMKRLLPLFGEIGDLKRITSAGRAGSIATRLFAAAWSDLAAGHPIEPVAFCTAARALVATRVADLDAGCLASLGIPENEAIIIQLAALAEVSADLDDEWRHRLAQTLGAGGSPAGAPPAFVAVLAAQPRAGITCPGRPRIVLQPAENHAEHCLVTAVYGVLLAPRYGADPAAVFLAGLAHHLHNVGLPDAGFAGEMLLGPHLETAMRRSTDAALSQLAPALRERVVAARRILADAATPEGRAFHAADVLDRVLEIRQHLGAVQLTMGTVLGEMGLVHDGPVKPFHDAVLAEMGLA